MIDQGTLRKPGTRPLTPQEWRHFLNHSDISAKDVQTESMTARDKRRVFDVIAAAFGHENIIHDSSLPVEWLGNERIPSSLQQTREIMWDLVQLGFRYELTELDRSLAPIEVSDVDAKIVAEATRRREIQAIFQDRPAVPRSLPVADRAGLWATEIKDRVASLEALRALVSRWPDAPTALRNAHLNDTDTVQHLVEMERLICQYYVQTFWEIAGRAAIVPRHFPFAT